MSDLTNLITNVGFPIVVAMYLLVRLENKIDTLILTVYDLLQAMEQKEIDKLDEQNQ